MKLARYIGSLAAIVVFYLLSIGPANRLTEKLPAESPIIRTCKVIYAPIILYARSGQWPNQPLTWYLELWSAN